MNLIESIEVNKISFPLIKPYVLSFATLSEFVSVQVTITLTNGENRMAEVVPLPGYVDETEESIIDFLNIKKKEFEGQLLKDVRSQLEVEIVNTPFASTALLTAIDLFNENLELTKLPSMVLATSVGSKNFIEDANQANMEGRCLKIKLTQRVDEDIAGMKLLFDSGFIPKKPIRMDANQAYSLDEAKYFYNQFEKYFDSKYFAYLEQPIIASDWNGLKELIKNYKFLPIMLDESVVSDEDLEKAIEIGAPFVKLKLFKQGGIIELKRQAKRSKKMGVNVVLGNGVATSICNDIENSLFTNYPNLFYGDSEANGFLKVQ